MIVITTSTLWTTGEDYHHLYTYNLSQGLTGNWKNTISYPGSPQSAQGITNCKQRSSEINSFFCL